MSTQTEPKLVTQIDFARAGQITPQMKEVAEREHRDPEYIRERVADGRIAIPANIVHIKKGMRAFGVGEGLSTKVNVNLGISGDKADAAEEWKKVKIAEDFGADAIMDLSNSGKTRQFRQQLIDETPLMVGTVPMYDAIGYMEKPLVKLTKDDLFEVVRAHAEDGVDFMTIHCGINKSVTKTFKETGRLMNIVSRGGSLLFGWMEVTGNENPFYEYFDELLEICHEYDVTISLGDSCRPGCLYDSNDATETAEMIELGKLCKRAWAAGVQVMVEGPGHMALDEIAANMKLQKRLCHNAPFYVLGPLVTDIGVGYDHITAAIGGAISASSGADFLCYVTPAEHLCLPNAQDVLDGLMATKIAAHAADIAKKVPHARDMDDKMGQARRKLDWDAMWKCALDPVTGKKRYEESPAATEGTCTMCGKMCAVRTVNKVFEGTTIDLGMEDQLVTGAIIGHKAFVNC
ncbi:phosphomethylpyrimidine synthase ThiC [Collinsella sp. LCP19S3_A6]|uniref:phosphomethylpyrimidine synthase ThiC n=1 Tax=Collinsella sp. LCP19S3_A6 TaxID=3438752 RepID=UPI003F938F23